MIRLFLISSMFFGSVVFAEPLPTFAGYTTQVKQKSLIKIDYESHEHGGSLKNNLEYQIGEPVNFGGRFRLAAVGCGTMCVSFVAINVDNGKIVDMVTASAGACFRPDSRLLVINPDIASMYDGEPPGWAYTVFYQITPFGFREVAKTKQDFTGPCD